MHRPGEDFLEQNVLGKGPDRITEKPRNKDVSGDLSVPQKGLCEVYQKRLGGDKLQRGEGGFRYGLYSFSKPGQLRIEQFLMNVTELGG